MWTAGLPLAEKRTLSLDKRCASPQVLCRRADFMTDPIQMRLLLAGVIIGIPLIPQLLGAILTFVRLLLRLDGRARSLPRHVNVDPYALAGTNNLGSHEVSVMTKYGNDGS